MEDSELSEEDYQIIKMNNMSGKDQGISHADEDYYYKESPNVNSPSKIR